MELVAVFLNPVIVSFVIFAFVVTVPICLSRIRGLRQWARSFAILFLAPLLFLAFFAGIVLLIDRLSGACPLDKPSIFEWAFALGGWAIIYVTAIAYPFWLGAMLGWLATLPIIFLRHGEAGLAPSDGAGDDGAG